MVIWVLIGVGLVGSMAQHKTHYYFFAILPLCFLGTVSLKLLMPERFQTMAISIVILGHVLLQIPYYIEWSNKTIKTALIDASQDMTQIIHQQSDKSIIPVMGEFSSQLGLFSERILSLDAYWNSFPPSDFCGRLKHWQPKFHVNVVVPGSARDMFIVNKYRKCDLIDHIKEIKRYPLPKPDNSVILLTRIYYRV